jgi:ribosomal peptide maturation radical SAM protein 1
MYKISLLNMPFASLSMPSLALTQLTSVVKRRFGDQVRVRNLYLNHEFAHYLGLDLYSPMTSSLAANNSGLGDWFFRQAAFPDQSDNCREYFERYFPSPDAETEVRLKSVVSKRAPLDRFVQALVVKFGLHEEDLVGFTSMFAQNAASFAMARHIKEKNPKVVTVIGGANCEAPMGRELALHVDALDFAVSGPALVAFPQLVQHLMDGEPERCQEIRGVYSAENAEGLKCLMWAGQELSVEVPVPLDYESFLRDLQRNFPSGLIKPNLTFETSRGCWWGERSHCTFCGLNGTTMAYRGMPSEMAIELFNELFEKYGDRCQNFDSVDNILPRQYLKEVFPRLDPPVGTSIFYEIKADLKEHEMETLVRAGVNRLQPGIESLSSSTLKLMGKGTTAFSNIGFLKYCVKYGIYPVWNLLIGFPGEEGSVYEKYLADIPHLKHLPPPDGAFPVRFDRYSPYFVKADEYHLDLKPYDFYSFIYPFPEESIDNMAYYFEDLNYSAEYIRNTAAWTDKLNAAVEDWQECFRRLDGSKPRAKLYLERKGNSWIVHDTRSGELVEHEVGALAARILECLSQKGHKIAHVAKYARTDPARAGEEVQRLRQQGLLFQESDRYISLVMEPGIGAADFKMPGFMYLNPSLGSGSQPAAQLTR